MTKELSRGKVVLGLSGGVDSTTAALLLKEHGYEVTGFYFDIFGNGNGVEDAKATAKDLDIPIICKDVSKEFDRIVISNFCHEYSCGRTPNPCVICNPNVKFKELLKTADDIGAYYIATGHYARIAYNDELSRYFIRRAANTKKDQSYMLYRLGQEYLSRLIFPLGEIDNKDITRKLAHNSNMLNYDKKDSQEICFVSEDKTYFDVLYEKGYNSKEGNFVDNKGNVLGKHKGIEHYTIGQRKGLGIALGKPVFVTNIDSSNNTVTLGKNDDIFENKLISINNFFADTNSNVLSSYVSELSLSAKIRYASKPSQCSIIESSIYEINCLFTNSQRAITPGQSVVYYNGDIVVGGGIIK